MSFCSIKAVVRITSTYMPDPEDNSRGQQSLPVLVLEHLCLDHRIKLVRNVLNLAVDLRAKQHGISKLPWPQT